MNKIALKNFATWSRRKLIEQVRTKAFLYGIDEKNGLHMEEQFGQLVINGHSYPLSMRTTFTALQKQLEQKGYEQLVEEIAYTWFNRIIAIRYMEVHEFLPEKVNVLSSTVGRVDPDILFEYDTMDLTIDEAKVRELLDAGDTEAAFRLLFVAQCNALNSILPFMFEKIQDYTELLLPDFLLDAESVIKTLVQKDELTESFEEIEVIGWLYQYYIAEEKDRVFAQKSKYKKEEIPFATQLFTPKWIVQYMVQNSLGRYWTEAHREDEDLIDNWEYFIKHEEEDFHEKTEPYVNKELKVEDIKLLDPAMGSGHILVYAFEVFHEIYAKCGYSERDIPRLILENNLYGLDIDDRAYQLASFAVVMKAASYSKRFLRSVEREGITLNLASIQETNHISDEVIAYIAQEDAGERYNQVKVFFDQYHNAKTYGSLINITEREISFIEERFEYIANNPVHDLFYGEQHEIAKEVLPALIHQTKIMRNEYDVVVMNPPYMGAGSMSKELGDFLKKNYPNSKADLFAAFMEVDFYLKKNSFYAVINQHSWMFLSSFEKLRKEILEKKFIDTMLHLGPRTFEEIGGEVVQSTTFVMRKSDLQDLNSGFIRLVDFKNSIEKKQELLKLLCIKGSPLRFSINQKRLLEMPFYTIAYWVSDEVLNLFKTNDTLESYANICTGMRTGDNERFLRYWFEIETRKIALGYISYLEMIEKGKKWVPYSKGGGYRKWYGNNDYVVNWENNGYEIKENTKRVYPQLGDNLSWKISNENFYFKKGLAWSALSSGNIAFRHTEQGEVFDTKGPKCFPLDEKNYYYLLGLLNSKVVAHLLELTSPTLDFNIWAIKNIPIKEWNEKFHIEEKVKENIKISKENWDMSETSWDFKLPRLLLFRSSFLKKSYENLKEYTINQFETLLNNENELNRIFIDVYNLNQVLDPNYSIEDISLSKWTVLEDVKGMLSYFIGCLVGRYSLDSSIKEDDQNQDFTPIYTVKEN